MQYHPLVGTFGEDAHGRSFHSRRKLRASSTLLFSLSLSFSSLSLSPSSRQVFSFLKTLCKNSGNKTVKWSYVGGLLFPTSSFPTSHPPPRRHNPRMSKIELIISKHKPSPAKIKTKTKIKITASSAKRPYLREWHLLHPSLKPKPSWAFTIHKNRITLSKPESGNQVRSIYFSDSQTNFYHNTFLPHSQ